MKKLLILSLIFIVILLTFPFAAAAAQQVSVFVDGEKLKGDMEPLIQNGRVLAPLRAVSEALGLRAEWSPSARVVHMLGDNLIISLAVDGKKSYINNKAVELDVPASIVNGRILAPVRFVAEALGVSVDWQEERRLVTIKDRQRYYDEILLCLKQNNLTEARRQVIQAPFKNIISQMPLQAQDMAKTTYYFPEGEAFRFYTRFGDHISYLEAAEDHISATIIGNLFSGFAVIPVTMEVEMKKDGDSWLFTSMENVQVYASLQQLQTDDPEMYKLLVKVYNYRRDQSFYIL